MSHGDWASEPGVDPGTHGALLRTTDIGYGADYWDSLDGGAGYQDSVMWADIAHALFEVLMVNRKTGVDRSPQFTVVDVGCAMGYLVRHFRRRGIEAWGLDFSTYALDHAPADVRPHLQWFDLAGLDPSFFGEGRFPLVTCFETLEHIPAEHTDRALRHLRRLAKPGGRLVFTICVEGNPDTTSDPTHVNIQTRAWWDERIGEAGLRIREDLLARLRRFWLFSQHHGVFVLQVPSRGRM